MYSRVCAGLMARNIVRALHVAPTAAAEKPELKNKRKRVKGRRKRKRA